MKPPKIPAALRPTFGIGVVIGAGVLLTTFATGSDPAMGLVLGCGTGIALGLTRSDEPDLTGTGKKGGEAGR